MWIGVDISDGDDEEPGGDNQRGHHIIINIYFYFYFKIFLDRTRINNTRGTFQIIIIIINVWMIVYLCMHGLDDSNKFHPSIKSQCISPPLRNFNLSMSSTNVDLQGLTNVVVFL